MSRTRFAIAALFAFLLAACATTPGGPTDEIRQALAPTGKLRVGLFMGTATMVVKDPVTGELKGVGYDLGKELAARIGVPFDPVIYPTLPSLFNAGKDGHIDVVFFGVNADRAKSFDFTDPYMEIDFGYLVPADSKLSSLGSVDQRDVRVVVLDKGSPDAFFSKFLTRATIVRAPALPAALEMIKAGKAEVFGALRGNLIDASSRQPGWRVLEGRPGAEAQALGVVKGRSPAALGFARQFVESAKASGAVQQAVTRVGLRGAVVARAN